MKNHVQSFHDKNEKEDFHIPLVEKLKSIPEVFGIRLNEEPNYIVLRKEGSFEVRRYAPQLLAQVTLKASSFDEFRERAFHKLAAYIFGGNKQKKDMAMTSPVLQQATAEKTWTMSFVLPAKYTERNAPRPDDSSIHLQSFGAYEAVAVQYSGNNSAESIQNYEKKLSDWLRKNPQLQSEGSFFTAQYDAPFVIPFFKKNEVLIKVTVNQ